MIKVYDDGKSFIEENGAYLKSNEYLSVFFFADAPLLDGCNKVNYAVKVTEGNKQLLALKVEPYNLMLFGDGFLSGRLLDYLVPNGYEIKSILGEESLCHTFADILQRRYQTKSVLSLAMDFLTTDSKVEQSGKEIDVAGACDVGQIAECERQFVLDCNLDDQIDEEKIAKFVDRYRVLRVDGVVASMARISRFTEKSMRITSVFTRKEFRGKGYATAVVASVVNEIVGKGCVATLNVDKNNPVSNHVYRSLGFAPLFSQSLYKVTK